MRGARPTPVLFVHHRRELGGASGALTLLLRHLDRARFEPHVYGPRGPSAELFARAGARVHTGPVAGFTHVWASTYHGARWLLLGRELGLLLPHLARLAAALRARPFALAHLNDSPLVAAAALARGAGLPVVWHLRAALPEVGGGARSALLAEAVRRLGARAVAINEDVAASFGGATVVHDGVDLERFRPVDPRAARAALGVEPDRPLVTYVGFVYPAKGYREFVHAAGLLAARGLDATYAMLGGGVRPERFFDALPGRAAAALDLAADHPRHARELAAALGVTAAFRFLPFVDPAPWYAASDVVVSPSQGPEVGLAAIEAAASGVPAVVTGTRTGGGVVVPGETGVVAARAPEDIAAAVAELLRDPERRRRLGAAARTHAERRFDPAASARAVEALYDEVLTGADRRSRHPAS